MHLDCSKAIKTCNAVCCSLHLFQRSFWSAHALKAVGVTEVKPHRESMVVVFTESMKCPFLSDNKCLVYADRPLVCEKYGTAEMPCPYIKTNGNLRSEAMFKRLFRQEHKKNQELQMEILKRGK